MKLICYPLIIIGGLTLFSSLRAQDAPSRPLREPSPEIEPTPLPKSGSTPTPRATPRKAESPVPKPSPPSTPEPSRPPTPAVFSGPEKVPETTEAEAVKESSTPVPVKSRRRAKEERSAQREIERVAAATPLSRRDARIEAAKLKAMEKQWEAAFSDPVVIEKSLADDFVGTSPAGDVMTKKALLQEAKEDTSPPPRTTARDLDVHFHGSNLAIVTGAARQTDRNRAGQLVEHSYRFTDTWVERNGEWRCVASQSMLIPR